MNYRVAERQAVTAHLAEFAKFDPHIKPLSAVYLEAHAKLGEQLKLRGITGESAHVMPSSPMSKATAQEWALRFAAMNDPESMVPFAKEHDKALVPFLEAHEASLEVLRRYVQSRVELQR